MGAGSEILDGLNDAVAGNFASVHINGQTWVRKGEDTPEHELSMAREKIAELTERVDVLEAEKAITDKMIALAQVKHHKLIEESSWLTDEEMKAVLEAALSM